MEEGLGPEIRQDILDFDCKQIEEILRGIKNEENKPDRKLSLIELLRIRHRAILDSSLESKLITLWAGIEEMWGEEKDQDLLLSKDEHKNIKKAIKPLVYSKKVPQKYNLIIQVISKLKNKTRNEIIIEELGKLECAKQWSDLPKTIGEIFACRSRFAHGKSLKEDDVSLVNNYISYLMKVFDELISKKLSELGIAFNQPI